MLEEQATEDQIYENNPNICRLCGFYFGDCFRPRCHHEPNRPAERGKDPSGTSRRATAQPYAWRRFMLNEIRHDDPRRREQHHAQIRELRRVMIELGLAQGRSSPSPAAHG
jgi:hypothetical protein